MIGVKHSGQLGDIIYSLPFLKSYISKNGHEKIVLFIPSDKKANRAKGLKHIGGDLMISVGMFNFIKPLLVCQNFIFDVIYMPEKEIPEGVLDLDLIRAGILNLSAGNIRSYYFKIFGLMDLCKGAWLEIPDAEEESVYDVIIGRSTRYLNKSIDYSVINDCNLKVGYIGSDYEFSVFSSTYPGLICDRIEVRTGLSAAQLILSSKIYIGNQSLFFALAEGLNHPRLLESFEPVPNVVPTPGNSGAFISTVGMMSMLAEKFPSKFNSERYAFIEPDYILSL